MADQTKIEWTEATLIHAFSDEISCGRIGKRAAGRLLDGRTWDEVPG